ncbi:hypothetical protein [Paenibacillus methanolicus]|uniref:Uncharacterized protein n=1 Tax=Paenibacillus methanolicus TaxID=582686 RepID=A0A5S5CAD1_9BACL|nr:hypothetical protein [Paenibacillus methanolicus]TYP76361.1 hypothetical protein BCM02_10322 [Paenibacillus methanolicus]
MREGRHGHHHGGHGHRGHGEGKGGRGHGEHRHMKSAQTFRRGRAVAFLDKLQLRRATLSQQLQQPEFEAIKTVISGELKAVDAIIQEFIHTFELHEGQDEAEGEAIEAVFESEANEDGDANHEDHSIPPND